MNPSSGNTPYVELDGWLLVALSVIAGMVDVSGYMTLGHVFTAHITGNLVVIAADFVSHHPLNPVQVIALPVFSLAAAGVWLLVSALGRERPHLVTMLLTLQCILLSGVLLCAVATHSSSSPGGFGAGLTAIVAVSAMACQFTLLRIGLSGAPATAVMTGNLVNASIALLDLLAAKTITVAIRRHFLRSVFLIAGFFLGCIAVAVSVPVLDDWVWLLPVVLAVATTLASALSKPAAA